MAENANHEEPYDVFLSYNSEDFEAVEKIAVYLKKKVSLLPWFDRWNLIPGKSIMELIELGLKASSAYAVFVGKSGQGPWQNKEVEIALRQQIQNTSLPVIPVLLPEAPQKPELPLFLQGNLWVEFGKNGLDDDDALWRLECGIRGVPPGQGRPQPENEEINKKEADKNSLKFVNRTLEIAELKKNGCAPYLLLSAPAGYGKSRLLHKLRNDFTAEGRLCIFVTLPGEHDYSIADISSDILQQIGEEPCPDKTSYADYGACVGSRLAESIVKKDSRRVILLLDRLETLKSSSIAQILEKFFPALQNVLTTIDYEDFRIILAGRYIGKYAVHCKLPQFSVQKLSPFNFNAVQKSVQQFFEKNSIDCKQQCKDEFIARLLLRTGGHPGCMAAILRDFSRELLLKEQWDNKEHEHYSRIIQPVINEIRFTIQSPELRRTFDILSAVRRFHAPLLKSFIEKKIITAYTNEYDLENELLQTYLIDREEDRIFLKDGITRRLLAIYRRKQNPDGFVRACREAIAFYSALLNNPASLRLEIIATELLFQQLQILDGEHNKSSDKFFKVLDETLRLLTLHDNPLNTLKKFKHFIMNDWEFCFMLDSTFDQTSYENLFDECIKKIDVYITQRQKGGELHV